MFKYFIAFFVFLYFFCDVKTSYSQNTKDTLLKQNKGGKTKCDKLSYST